MGAIRSTVQVSVYIIVINVKLIGSFFIRIYDNISVT